VQKKNLQRALQNVENVENMFIFPPLTQGYTVYSKSGCGYCTKIKKLLLEKNIFFLEVECDNFLLENKEQFYYITDNNNNLAFCYTKK
jgi:hypothetical protein